MKKPNHFGHLSGIVRDKATQKPIANVEIILHSLNRGDVTDAQGRFQIDRVPAGEYELIARRQGYRPLDLKPVRVKAGQTTELKLELQQTVIEMNEIVVTASRTRELEQQIPQLVSVISEKNIRDRGVSQTPETLREEMGVFVQKTNQGGGSPILRGLRSNKLLLLIDGIRMNNATYRGGNLQYLNTIDPFSLGRIEVVHGPVSALYGSDALGGAINLITRNPVLSEKPGLRLVQGRASAYFSSADRSQSVHLGLMGGFFRWGALVDVTYRSFGDITRGRKGGRELMRRLEGDSRTRRNLQVVQSPNGFESLDLTVKTLFQPGDNHRFTALLQMNYQPSVPRYDVYEVGKYSTWNYQPQERELFYLTYRHQSRNFFFHQAYLSFSLHRQFERRIRQKVGSFKLNRDAFGTNTTGFQLQLNRLIAAKHLLVYGLEWYHDWVGSASEQRNLSTGETQPRVPLFPDGSTYIGSGIFAQAEFIITPRWKLDAGVRYSAFRLRASFKTANGAPADFGTVTQTPHSLTASIGSQFSLTPGISLVANVAQGFRAPNLDDVSKLGPGKGGSFYDVPNPTLRPERNLSFDLGIKIMADRFRAQFMAYYNRLNHLLVRRPAFYQGLPYYVEESDTLRVYHKENVGQAYTTGFALDFHVLMTQNWIFTGNLGYTYGQDLTHAQPLSAIPPFHGTLGWRWQWPRVWLELFSRFAASQERLSSEDQLDLRIPEGATPGWWTLNFRGGVRVRATVWLRIYLSNVLDRNYREHLSGFNAPGRSFALSGEVGF